MPNKEVNNRVVQLEEENFSLRVQLEKLQLVLQQSRAPAANKESSALASCKQHLRQAQEQVAKLQQELQTYKRRADDLAVDNSR
eukprot:gene6519-3158_t